MTDDQSFNWVPSVLPIFVNNILLHVEIAAQSGM